MGVSSFDILKANGIYAPQVMNTTGKVYFVNNATTGLPDGAIGGSNGNSGLSPLEPFSTIDYAVGQCVGSRGDVIYVMPGHSEAVTAAGGIDLDVAGISVIGLGNGRNRATITFTTAAGADIDFDAANIKLSNFFITTVGVASVTAPFDINAADCEISDCEIILTDATNQAVRGVVTATAAARFKFLRNTLRAPTAGASSAINLVGTEDGVEIAYNHIYGDFAVAAIENATGAGNVLTNVDVHHNYIQNLNAADWAIEMVAACTGVIRDNYLVSDAIGTALDPGSCYNFKNEWIDSDLADSRGVLLPVAVVDSTGNPLGADSSNNDFASTNVAANEDGSILERLEQVQEAVNRGTGTSIAANKSVADAIGFDGSAVVTATAGMLRTAAGMDLVVTKTLTSSAVTQAGVDVTGVSSGGVLFLKDWSLRTNATGLATGTNFTLEVDNALGAAVFASHAVGSLGANVLIDKKTATTGKDTLVESGKKIIAKCTVADCTGAGTIAVDLYFARGADNATIAAA